MVWPLVGCGIFVLFLLDKETNDSHVVSIYSDRSIFFMVICEHLFCRILDRKF